MKLKLFAASLFVAAACGGSTPPPAEPAPAGDPGAASIANPASVYCGEIGGELTMVEGEGGTSGICKKDGAECDEWALFRGECPEMAPGKSEPATDEPAADGAE